MDKVWKGALRSELSNKNKHIAAFYPDFSVSLLISNHSSSIMVESSIVLTDAFSCKKAKITALYVPTRNVAKKIWDVYVLSKLFVAGHRFTKKLLKAFIHCCPSSITSSCLGTNSWHSITKMNPTDTAQTDLSLQRTITWRKSNPLRDVANVRSLLLSWGIQRISHAKMKYPSHGKPPKAHMAFSRPQNYWAVWGQNFDSYLHPGAQCTRTRPMGFACGVPLDIAKKKSAAHLSSRPLLRDVKLFEKRFNWKHVGDMLTKHTRFGHKRVCLVSP